MAARYAVYYAPEAESALWRLGSEWLGRDAETGATLRQPDIPEIVALTTSPRRYGLHATLKAPIRLADGTTEAEFLDAVATWAASETPFQLPRLDVGSLGDFLALRLSKPCPELIAMAGRCVRSLDRFRKPPSDAELARRRIESLPAAERAHLLAWGYPYVFECYRFHITLSDSIADDTLRARLHDAAAAWLEAAELENRPMAEACVFAQAAADQPFILTHRFGFSA
jgi:putative phosphonate metabolism protein